MIGSFVLIIPLFIFMDHALLFMTVICLIIGFTMIACPFCTPQTVESSGVKRSITLARWGGVFFIVMGLIFALLYPMSLN